MSSSIAIWGPGSEKSFENLTAEKVRGERKCEERGKLKRMRSKEERKEKARRKEKREEKE